MPRATITTLLAATLLRGVPAPVAARQHGRGLDGTWRGTLTTARAPLRLSVRISQRADGIYLGTFTSLDEGAVQLPIDRIQVTGDSVRMEVRMLAATFSAVRSADGERLVGTWQQGRAPLSLELTRSILQAESGPGPDRTAGPPLDPAWGFPLLIDATISPTPFAGAGRTHLAYELRLTNYNVFDDAFVTRIEVMAGDSTLARHEGVDLNALITNPFARDRVDNRVIEPGRGAVAYLWLTFDSGLRIPTILHHRVTLHGGQRIDGAPVRVSSVSLPPIGPPLRGAGWVAAGGPSNGAAHRHALLPLDGKARIAQRFAIDWIRLGPNGSPFAGDRQLNANYPAYGAEVIAVSDGIVASIHDGVIENTPGNAPAVPITPQTASGNYIILDIGGGRFAFYAHLQPGAAGLRVKLGERVKRGQVIGLVGNSGNSQWPHLHFHIADANSPMASEGLPYALNAFEAMTPAGAWETRTRELPMGNARVRFP